MKIKLECFSLATISIFEGKVWFLPTNKVLSSCAYTLVQLYNIRVWIKIPFLAICTEWHHRLDSNPQNQDHQSIDLPTDIGKTKFIFNIKRSSLFLCCVTEDICAFLVSHSTHVISLSSRYFEKQGRS